MKKLLNRTSVFASAGLLSILSVALLYKSSLGVNFLILTVFIALVILTAAIIFKRFSISVAINLILLLILAFPFVITSFQIYKVIVLLFWMYVLTLSLYSLVLGNEDYNLWRYLTIPFESFVMSLISPIFPLTKMRFSKNTSVNVLIRIGFGAMITIPFFGIFLALLLSADMAFGELFKSMFSGYFIKDSILIILWILTAFWMFFGGLYYHLFQKEKMIVQEKRHEIKKSRFFIEGLTVSTIIGILFFFFNIVQLRYLFGGESEIMEKEFSYSEYARRGFTELIIVSILAISLISAIVRVIKVKELWQDILVRIMGISWSVLLIPITLSSFYRLYVYEDTYGFTRLRVYSHFFVMGVFVILLWMIFSYGFKFKQKLGLYVSQVVACITIAFIGILNLDGIIARFNIERVNKGDTRIQSNNFVYAMKGFFRKSSSNDIFDELELDLKYIAELSYDAVPALFEYYENSENEEKYKAASYLKYFYNKMLFEKKKYNDVRSYSVRRETAYNLLETYKEMINKDADIYEASVRELHIEDAVYRNDEYCDQRTEFVLLDDNGQSIYYLGVQLYNPGNLHLVDSKHIGDCTRVKPGHYLLEVEYWSGGIQNKKEYFEVNVSEDAQVIFMVAHLDTT